MLTPDINLIIARLQSDISQKLGLPLENLVFNYVESAEGVGLELITINPKHDQSFLFHAVSGSDKQDALQKMVEYVLQNSKQKSSYTVQWTQKGLGELHTSYFRARDIYEVLEKFYHGRDKDRYTIFSITLNPVA
ncbi:MAG: hypothetical protein OHK0039_34590 [Bacteroidia bacterium]